MDWSSIVWDNMNKVLSSLDRAVNLTIMSTYNALSVPNYRPLLHNVYDLKEKYFQKIDMVIGVFRFKLFTTSTTHQAYKFLTRCLE